jgi:hypothetical protein
MDCPTCDTIMDCEDFYQDDNGEYFDIYICPKCNTRMDVPE